MLASLTAKRIGWNGEIVTDPSSIATIYRYNFSRTLSNVNSIISKYSVSSFTASEILSILPSSALNTTTELIDLYFNNDAVLSKLLKLMKETKILNDYLALKEIYEYCMMGKTNTDIFKKSDGVVASTYLDYLSDSNTLVANYINDLETAEDIITAIDSLLTTLETYIDTSRFEYLFLKIPSFSNESVFKFYLLKIINVFKAFNINIFSMSITYNIDDTKDNIKIIDSCNYHGYKGRNSNASMFDSISYGGYKTISSTIGITDSIEYQDKDGNIYTI